MLVKLSPSWIPHKY